MCLAQEIYTAATVADHVQPHRGDRNKFWFGELQSLCAGCHSGDKKRLEDGLPLRGSDADGWPR
jgi:hypothetical protein